MFRRILVGSGGSRLALKRSIELAKALDAELVSISVEEHWPSYAASISAVKWTKEQVDEHFRALTKQARDLAALSGVELDLLVIGYHGPRAIFDRVMAGTAQSSTTSARPGEGR